MTLNEHCFQGAERERWWLIARGMRPTYQPTNGRSAFVAALDIDRHARAGRHRRQPRHA